MNASHKVILIVSDALRNDTAQQQMGYLELLVETNLASRYCVISQLPTVSRPLYETIQTGVPPSDHGITSNHIVRCSKMPNVFETAAAHGKVTAAAAYSWYSELYNRAPYNPLEDKEIDDPTLPIQHGRFYAEDSYPDVELFATAGALVHKFSPDYLVIHPMGMDYIGECYGANSSEYRNHATYQDQILAYTLPRWLEAGYTILVTADHGMTDDKTHGGTLPAVRHVPLYIIPPNKTCRGDTQETVSQLQIAPTLCHLLGLPIPDTMTQPIIND